MKSKLNFLAGIMLPLIIAVGCASKPPEPGAVASNANDPERIICRNEAPVGSRLPKRVCKSALEWEAIAEEQKEDRRSMQRGAVGPGEGGSLPGN